VALGAMAKGLRLGQCVGVGWGAGNCMHCRSCLSGNQSLCESNVPTIVGHYGGFADRVGAQWPWAIPLPDKLDGRDAGPLLCGGVTVFAPLKILGVKPTDRIGVVGIHLALKFARAWGCEVTAFTSTSAKADEARAFGAHHVVNSRDEDELRSVAKSLDLLLVTVNVPLNWPGMIPKRTLALVGAVLEPNPINAFDLIMTERNVSGGRRTARLSLWPTCLNSQRATISTEHFPLDRVNDAIAHQNAGKARYRIVLDM
jgi:alcohol/geraniol dehydrogenase (NADP+)